MTGFITDGYSCCLNTQHIRKIDIRKTAALVFFTSGGQESQESFAAGSPVYKALCTFLDHLDSAGRHVIPAAPGYMLLTFIAPDDADPATFDIEGGLERSAVIAWNVYDGEPFAHQLAIAVDGDSTGDCSAVLAPDGTVFAADCRYAAIEEWIEALRASWAESRVRRPRLVKQN